MCPPIYSAVRAVGILKPKLQDKPAGKIFADSLDVRGTAFWLKNEQVLVTCAHVVKGLTEIPLEVAGILMVGNRGNYHRATVAVVDFQRDLAVLNFVASPEVVEAESRAGLEIADHYPEVGTRVAYAGFPLGNQLMTASNDPTYSVGVVGAQKRQSHRKSIQISGAVIGGYSGAPVVREDNPSKVIGVVSDSPSVEAGQAGIFMASSWEHLRILAQLSKS